MCSCKSVYVSDSLSWIYREFLCTVLLSGYLSMSVIKCKVKARSTREDGSVMDTMLRLRQDTEIIQEIHTDGQTPWIFFLLGVNSILIINVGLATFLV